MKTDKQLLASRPGRRLENNTDSDHKGIVKDDEKLVRLKQDRGL
jgi:hypothetical protein